MNSVRFAVLVVFAIANLPRINAQAQMTPEGGELVDFIAAEQQRGSVLTYAQSYVDDENEKVSYKGTLYAGIHHFKLDECKVTVRVAIQDTYSGPIEHRTFGRVHLSRQASSETILSMNIALALVSSARMQSTL